VPGGERYMFWPCCIVNDEVCNSFLLIQFSFEFLSVLRCRTLLKYIFWNIVRVSFTMNLYFAFVIYLHL
jgi:hypothetical protein